MSGATGPLGLCTLTIVGVDTGMLPGAMFVLEWAKVTSAAHLIHEWGRVYKGELDLPKSNRERTTAPYLSRRSSSAAGRDLGSDGRLSSGLTAV